MNSLKFLLLRRKWIAKIGFGWTSFLAVASAALLPCGEKAAQAGEENPVVEMESAIAQCKQDHFRWEKPIYKDESSRALEKDFDPTYQCKNHPEDDSNSINGQVLLKTPNVLRHRSLLVDSESGLISDEDMVKLGSCSAAFRGIREVYDLTFKLKVDFCQQFSMAKSGSEKCGKGIIELSCKNRWEELKKTHEELAANLRKKSLQISGYLNALTRVAEKARNEYENDSQKIRAALKKNPFQGSDIALLGSNDCSPDTRDIPPYRGNRTISSCREYYNLLVGESTPGNLRAATVRNQPSTHGPLINELDKAVSELNKFNEQAKDLVGKEINLADRQAEYWGKQIAESEKSGKATNGDKKDSLSNIADLTSSATNILGNKQKTGSTTSSSPISSFSGGGGSPAPQLATLAAAGAVSALAARSLSSSQSGPSGSPSPSRREQSFNGQPAPRETSLFAEVSSNRKNERKNTEDTGRKPVLKTEENLKLGAPEATSPQVTNNEGSSRMISGKKGAAPPKPTPATPENSAPTGGGFNDDSSAFKQSPLPSPPPLPPKSGVDNDVANLLGQMKNLFNLDESGGGGGFGGGSNPFSGPPPLPSSDAPHEPGAEAPPELAAEAPPAEGEQTPANEPSFENKHNNSQTQASAFGSSDVTLFARVRSRYQHYMQRGLILYDLKEGME